MGVDVVTTSPGDGVTFPKAGEELSVHYTGRLVSNGKKFDSSVDRGREFRFIVGVGTVIRGWDEGMMRMSLGEKATLRITADFGYGADGAGDAIPPNADLEFDVHLIAIGAKRAAGAPPAAAGGGGCVIL
eukprot:a515384_15.p1 GENE.a515384_15~~a515384_15.p1  ORF type:complete len:142 (-),score=35.04 a515384_15:44-433(-)